MSSMTSSATVLIALLTVEEAKAIEPILQQKHIAGQDVRKALRRKRKRAQRGKR